MTCTLMMQLLKSGQIYMMLCMAHMRLLVMFTAMVTIL